MIVRWRYCVFKQKTAYEMRISDWSSDVCSSDLVGGGYHHGRDTTAATGHDSRPERVGVGVLEPTGQLQDDIIDGVGGVWWETFHGDTGEVSSSEIGRASCRERVCQYV